MVEAITNIFGNSISEKDYAFPSGTPAYILYGYSVKECIYFQKSFLIASPLGENINLGTIKKHVQKIEQLCALPCAIIIPQLTALQRSNLVKNQIAFIAGSGQIFLPFLGCYFENRIAEPVDTKEAINEIVHKTFINAYNHLNGDFTNPKR